MAKTMVLLLIGATVGGLATFVLRHSGLPGEPRNTVIAAPATTSLADRSPADPAAGLPAPDAAALQAAIEQRATAPLSYTRNFELEVWLAELGEVDPARAARLALQRGLPRELIESAFKFWAESDPTAVLDELRAISQPMQRTIALALTDVIGTDPASVETIADRMPGIDRMSFQIDALRRLIRNDPDAAMRQALELPDPTARRLVFADLGMAWGALDPESALAAADTYPGTGPRYQSQILQQWARLDVHGYLDYVTRESTSSDTASFEQAALSDPLAALAAAKQVSDSRRRLLFTTEAMRVLARQDPVTAIAQLDFSDSGSASERDALLRAVASSYAEVDPASAVAWVESLDPPSIVARQGMLSAMASTDLERTLDLVLASPESLADSPTWFREGLSQGPQIEPNAFARIADKLARSQDVSSPQLLQWLGPEWARTDPDGAVAWAIANGENGAPMLNSVASELGTRDFSRIMSLADRVPAQQSTDWIVSGATAHASINADAALSAIERIRDDPGFADAAAVVVRRAALQNADATSAWVIGLPNGSLRDAALGSLIEATTTIGLVDANWLGAFSTPTARQNALLDALPRYANDNPTEARQLIDSYFSDPELRERAEAAIENPGQGPFVVVDGRPIFPPE